MARSQQTRRALELSEKLLTEAEARPAADTLLLSAMFPGLDSGHDAEALTTFLERRVEAATTEGDPVALGVAHYNLANNLRRTERYRKALHHYREAARVHPAYAERDYYCREIASLLFVAGFFRVSARFYAEAVKRGGPAFWRALYADALLFAGRFIESRDAFREYFDVSANPKAEWELKR